MRFRWLGIAFSAACLIMCALLIALWVRSYCRLDGISGPTPDEIGFQVYSTHGWIVYSKGSPAGPEPDKPWEINLGCDTSSEGTESDNIAFRGFDIVREPCATRVCIPHWFPLLLTATLAITPWFRLRFGLRTLLITMTFVALGIGLAVCAAKKTTSYQHESSHPTSLRSSALPYRTSICRRSRA